MTPPQGPHIHGAYMPPPAEPPRWSIVSGDSGDGRSMTPSPGGRPPLQRVHGDPDPRQRQLRMESLQALSEAARRADNAAGAPPRPPLQRVHGDVSKATHSRGAYDSGDGDSTVGDGDSSPRSPRSPLTPTRPTTLSVISELDTIQSEYTEEPSSPHSPSPTSIAVRDIDHLLDASAPRAPRDKLDHYYAAPTRHKSCCVIA